MRNRTQNAKHTRLRIDAARAAVIVHGGVGDRRALGAALGLDQTALVVPGHAGGVRSRKSGRQKTKERTRDNMRLYAQPVV